MTQMSIKNGRLRGVRFREANNYGGAMKPELIVLHDTAGRLTKYSSVNWFCSRKCRTSAHIVVERDGSITQQVPFDRKAYHAGKSEWNGRRWCNGFSVGIEIVNPGKLDKDGKAWFGKATDLPIEKQKTSAHGEGWWLPYSTEQIKSVKAICRAIMEEFPDCNEVTTHWAISPGRKIDPNPLCPIDEIREYAMGKTEMEPEAEHPHRVPEHVERPVEELAPVSRKVRSLSRVRALLNWLGVTLAGLFTMDNLMIAKGAIQNVKSLVADNLGLGTMAVVAVCAALFCHYLLGLIKADIREGRYQPSGK